MTDWIKHTGDECPVHPDTVVDWKAEYDRLKAAADELAGRLAKLLGPTDDPRTGWHGSTPPTPDHFQCEHCGTGHLDCTKIPHAPQCPITEARAALTKYQQAKDSTNGQ